MGIRMLLDQLTLSLDISTKKHKDTFLISQITLVGLIKKSIIFFWMRKEGWIPKKDLQKIIYIIHPICELSIRPATSKEKLTCKSPLHPENKVS